MSKMSFSLLHAPRLMLILAIGLILLGFYLLPAAYFPLIDMDEGAYAAVSREMWLSGDWWTTVLNGDPFFHKPVLMYWLQSLGLMLVGEGRLAYRLSSIIAFGLWLWTSYKFIAKYLDLGTAKHFIWIALFATGNLVIFKAAIPDAWLILFISLALYKAVDFLESGQSVALNWAFIWTGFGLLAKGPIALVIVAGTLFFVLVLRRDWQQLFTMMGAWRGWLLMVLVALPWYALQMALYGQTFFNEFFGVHNVGRFLSPMEDHTGSVFYYVFALILLTLPFFPALLIALKRSWQLSRVSRVWMLLVVWFLLVWVFFTLAATKLPHYLMYGMPPVFIALAYVFTHYGQSRLIRWGTGLTLSLLALLLAALPWLLTLALEGEDNAYVLETFSPALTLVPDSYFWILAGVFLVGLLLMLARWSVNQRLIASGLAMAVTVNFAVFNYLVVLQQQPIVNAAAFVKANNLTLVTCCIEMPSFNIEAQQITPKRMPLPGEVVFGKTYELEQRLAHFEVLWRDRGVSIVRVLEE